MGDKCEFTRGIYWAIACQANDEINVDDQTDRRLLDPNFIAETVIDAREYALVYIASELSEGNVRALHTPPPSEAKILELICWYQTNADISQALGADMPFSELDPEIRANIIDEYTAIHAAQPLEAPVYTNHKFQAQAKATILAKTLGEAYVGMQKSMQKRDSWRKHRDEVAWAKGRRSEIHNLAGNEEPTIAMRIARITPKLEARDVPAKDRTLDALAALRDIRESKGGLVDFRPQIVKGLQLSMSDKLYIFGA